MERKLSRREEQILKLILAEYSQNHICKVLDLSYSRVNSVKSIIMEKWAVETTVGLVLKAIKLGYLEVEDDTFEEETVKPTLNYTEYIYAYDKTTERIERRA